MVEVRFSGVSGKGSEVLRRIPTGICVEAKAGWRKITYLFYFFGLSETKTDTYTYILREYMYIASKLNYSHVYIFYTRIDLTQTLYIYIRSIHGGISSQQQRYSYQ